MQKVTDTLERTLVPVATKIQQNKVLRAVGNGFASSLTIIIVGAIFTLLGSFQWSAYQSFLASTGIGTILSYAPLVTTDMLAVYIAFLIGKSFTEELGLKDNASFCGILSLFAFLLMMPLGVSELQGETTVEITSALGLRWLGAQGLFTAIIIGLIVPLIYAFIIKRNIVIKMPDGVPPTIAKSFSALIPGFVIAILFSIIRHFISLTTFGDLNTFIYGIIQEPLTSLGASPLTFVLFIVICNVLWFFGIHGGAVVMPFLQILYAAPALENLVAYGAGEPLPHSIIQAGWFVYANMGGAGGTFGLVLILAFMAKSKRYKTLGRMALPTVAVGINEPLTFGLPVVLNPIIILPFIITPITSFLLSYGLTLLGILPPLNGVTIPLGTPIIFSGWLTGGIPVMLFQIVNIFIQVAIYYPFTKVLDSQALAEEVQEDTIQTGEPKDASVPVNG
ncbi:PTS sugar transporter subunit IIC [Marinilactibacillus kalidii]|uniref:PTS sugar transporter subunit IIC n=1 Tax=Marinilactibacillus kalidii TaxID=2820274 RepID=UPI001ABE2413|nr:PTS transporter subunit EIIC [Marinilactibacillus kalidii]